MQFNGVELWSTVDVVEYMYPRFRTVAWGYSSHAVID